MSVTTHNCLQLMCWLTHIFRGQGGAREGFCFQLLAAPGPQARGCSCKEFLSVGASDAVISLDSRMQYHQAQKTHPGRGCCKPVPEQGPFEASRGRGFVGGSFLLSSLCLPTHPPFSSNICPQPHGHVHTHAHAHKRVHTHTLPPQDSWDESSKLDL